jgi:Ni,Fe-hydrogenase III large subunit
LTTAHGSAAREPATWDAPKVVPVPASRWRDAVAAATERRERFAGLHAKNRPDGPEVRALFAGPTLRLLVARAERQELPTVVDLVPAAVWDEREAHDLYGVRFPGHEPLRPLVQHDPDLSSWTVAVRGRDPYQVAVGPIHAGVIESGHFRFHVVGERILHVDLRLFYKHRGLELAAEGADPSHALRLVQRACAACSVTNSVAYAQACESALGLWPDSSLANNRTLLLELERLWNHLNDISAICAGVGFAAGTMAFAALKERAQRLNARLAGHRFLFDTVSVASASFQLERQTAREAHEELRELRAQSRRAWREVLFNASVQGRLGGVGVVEREQAAALGTVGPAARASGISRDVRAESPRLSYADFKPSVLADPSCDVRARLEMRALELETTLDLLETLLTRPLEGGAAQAVAPSSRIGVGRVESPRGETVCVVELGEGRVDRLHLRTGSYANWPSVAHAAAENLLPDFPLINKSFELCYACSDR